MSAFDVGHFCRHRHQIVGHIPVEKLAAIVIKAMLEQGRADTLHDAAADLLIDKLGIDDGAAVFHAPVLQKFHEARVDIDLKITCLDTVGESERPRARHIVPKSPSVRPGSLAAGCQGGSKQCAPAHRVAGARYLSICPLRYHCGCRAHPAWLGECSLPPREHLRAAPCPPARPLRRRCPLRVMPRCRRHRAYYRYLR